MVDPHDEIRDAEWYEDAEDHPDPNVLAEFALWGAVITIGLISVGLGAIGVVAFWLWLI